MTDLDRELFAAIQSRNIDEIRRLLLVGANANALTEIGSPGAETPLMCAVMSGLCEITQILLEYGANPSAETPSERGVQSRTVLMCAIANGHVEIVRLLIDYDVNVNAVNDGGLTALGYAERRKMYPHLQERMIEVIALLQEAGAIR